MEAASKKLNWKMVQLTFVASFVISLFIDESLKFNNYTYLIDVFIPLLFGYLYREFTYENISENQIQVTELDKIQKTNKWKHKLFSFFGFLCIGMTTFRAVALFTGVILYTAEINYSLFLTISLTTILLSIFGDFLLLQWYKAGGLVKALDNKDSFFSQNDFKLFIYFFYFIVLVYKYDTESRVLDFWVATFAAYVAFERFWKFLQERNKKPLATK